MPTGTAIDIVSEDAPRKSIMRSLGEFVGHIMAGVKADPTRDRHEVRRTVEEEKRGDMILRRTTIEEVELRDPADDGQEQHR